MVNKHWCDECKKEVIPFICLTNYQYSNEGLVKQESYVCPECKQIIMVDEWVERYYLPKGLRW